MLLPLDTAEVALDRSSIMGVREPSALGSVCLLSGKLFEAEAVGDQVQAHTSIAY